MSLLFRTLPPIPGPRTVCSRYAVLAAIREGRCSPCNVGIDGSFTEHIVAAHKSVLLEISRLLNTGLDMETLSICVRLCEQGINPEALSSVIKELRRASEGLKASENAPS